MSQHDEENEYMSLAPGFGIVPEKYRNRGYEKLGIKPGEGGIGLALRKAKEEPMTKSDMVAALREVMGTDDAGTTPRRGRR